MFQKLTLPNYINMCIIEALCFIPFRCCIIFLYVDVVSVQLLNCVYLTSSYCSAQSSSSSSHSATESRDRASTYSNSRGVHEKPSRPTSFTSPVNQSSLETQQSAPEEDTSPLFSDGNMRTPLTHVTMLQHASRRNSFLYQGDSEDAPTISSPKPTSRSPSVSRCFLCGVYTPTLCRF